ncbi:MAG: radical SAM family heme chaperone HemW [Oscillospiraceae bacterium]|nr:radical SAM family heme chaperone HemW [Oscillospiraceae bacterium]
MEAGLYIHIPYCKKKCNYCDFYSCGGCDIVPQEYVDAVVREIGSHRGLKCKTVYFGGGTPSLLTANQVKQILAVADIMPGAEITLEANPDTLTQEKLDGYYAAGVNRLSIGVQTVYDKSLQVLGRIHSAEKAGQAFDMARAAGFVNISGDVMLGLDNYSVEEMKDTIDFLIDHGAVHISAYLLKVEEGTPFYTNRPENLATEEELADYYLACCEYMAEKGFIQYEISNFCHEGYHSRHNSIYWQLDNYLGIGPSAHSCMDGKRFYYERNVDAFIKGCQPVADGEVDADDYIMLSLRLKTGLDINTLKEKWWLEIDSRTMKKLEIYRRQGVLTIENNCISLTPAGFLAENVIASDIMSGVE